MADLTLPQVLAEQRFVSLLPTCGCLASLLFSINKRLLPELAMVH